MRVCFLVVSCLLIAFPADSCVVADVDPPAADQNQKAVWKFGVAAVNITPEVPMLMSGYASRDRPAEGKLTDLWAKALVLEDASGKKCALITLDLVGTGRRFRQLVGRELKARYDLQNGEFAICNSHTHTGPAVSRNLTPMVDVLASDTQKKQIEDYTSATVGKVVDLVHQAISDMRPGSLSWGSGNSTFGANRRNNSERDIRSLRTAGTIQGPFDHDVPVLAVRDENEKLRAIVFGYACHATVLSSYQWSGDYPGFAQIELENRYPGCVAMFWAGCGADQNPLPRRSDRLASHYGRQLATSVEAVLLTHEMRPVKSQLVTAYAEIPLSYAAVPTADQIQSDSESRDRFVAARAKLMRHELDVNGKIAKTYPYPIASWQLGDLQFVFLGGEVVVDFSIRLKEELRGKQTWVAAYTNDVMAYIPTERVLREGGYEGGGAMVYYGLPSAWAPGLEQEIVDKVREQLGGDREIDR